IDLEFIDLDRFEPGKRDVQSLSRQDLLQVRQLDRKSLSIPAGIFGNTIVSQQQSTFLRRQRITSGPAAMAAASRRRQSSKRKQAGYMTAPERFADTSDSSCTAGAVHTILLC